MTRHKWLKARKRDKQKRKEASMHSGSYRSKNPQIAEEVTPVE